jgi:hypothetical protein
MFLSSWLALRTTWALLVAASLASAGDAGLVVTDVEAVAAKILGETFEHRRAYRHHRPTGLANKMAVVVPAEVVAGGARAEVVLLEKTERAKHRYGPVDGGPARVGTPTLDLEDKSIGCEVLISLQERAHDHPTRRRDSKPGTSESVEDGVDVRIRSSDHAMHDRTPVAVFLLP